MLKADIGEYEEKGHILGFMQCKSALELALCLFVYDSGVANHLQATSVTSNAAVQTSKTAARHLKKKVVENRL